MILQLKIFITIIIVIKLPVLSSLHVKSSSDGRTKNQSYVSLPIAHAPTCSDVTGSISCFCSVPGKTKTCSDVNQILSFRLNDESDIQVMHSALEPFYLSTTCGAKNNYFNLSDPWWFQNSGETIVKDNKERAKKVCLTDWKMGLK